MTGEQYDGEVSTPIEGNRDFENTARGKALRDDFLNSTHDSIDSEILDILSHDSPQIAIPSEYLPNSQYIANKRSLLEGIITDWSSKTPISPLVSLWEKLHEEGSIDIEDLYKTEEELFDKMSLVSEVSRKLKGQVSSISSPEDVVKVLKAIRRSSGIHLDDIFDTEWVDIPKNYDYEEGRLPPSKYEIGHEQIMKGYPYARVRFSIDMPDGFDEHQKLMTFNSGDISIFGNQFGTPSNLFWFYDGLLFAASSFNSRDGSEVVFIHGDGDSIRELPIEEVTKEFYDSRIAQGKDYSTDVILQHMRDLFSDNNRVALKSHLKSQIMRRISNRPLDEVLVANEYLREVVDEFAKTKREELIIKKDLERIVDEGIKIIMTRLQDCDKLKRGDTPLYKISGLEGDDIYDKIDEKAWSALQEERVGPFADES